MKEGKGGGLSVVKQHDDQDLLSHLSSTCSLFLFYVNYPYQDRFPFDYIFLKQVWEKDQVVTFLAVLESVVLVQWLNLYLK